MAASGYDVAVLRWRDDTRASRSA